MSVETRTAFLLRVAEAATWCDYLLTHRRLKTLRAPELATDSVFQECVSISEQEHYVKNAILSRRSLIKSEAIPLHAPDMIVEKGRLLFSYPNQMKSGGLLNYSTGGFFDENDLPPVDTWVCFGKYARRSVMDHFSWHTDLLISWVPKCYVKQVDIVIKPGMDHEVSWGSQFEWVHDESGFLSAISMAI